MDQTFEKRKKLIYEFICDEFYVPMKLKELAILLQVPKDQRNELKKVMDSLEADGRTTQEKYDAKLEMKKLAESFGGNVSNDYTGYDGIHLSFFPYKKTDPERVRDWKAMFGVIIQDNEMSTMEQGITLGGPKPNEMALDSEYMKTHAMCPSEGVVIMNNEFSNVSVPYKRYDTSGTVILDENGNITAESN